MNLPTLRRKPKQELERSDPSISLQDWAGLLTQFGWNGTLYTLPGQGQEEIAPNYTGLAGLAYKTNAVVFACVTLRQLILSEARFAFRERRNGRAGNLFSTAALAPLEVPWPGATTGDLISRMELDASLGGNWFGTSRFGGVRTLRPDWMTLIVGSLQDETVAAVDPEAEVVGYAYHPGGRGGGRDPIIFMADEVAHYAPHPDPLARFRGMSWVNAVVREIMADKAATDHKLTFYENAATPNLHISLDTPDLETYRNFVREFRRDHESTANAYKTLFTTSAVDVTPVGMDFKQMDFKVTQGAGETRIATAARTPPALVGLSEGLQGSSLNAGNFEAATKLFVDMFARPQWRNMAGSLSVLVPAPNSGSELWYDDRDIPALQEDIRKAGERMQADSASIASLVSTAGFTPESSVEAVTSNDLSRLVHSGLIPVQQQAPPAGGAKNGTGGDAAPSDSGANSARYAEIAEHLRELVVLSQQRQRPLEIHNHVPEQLPASVPDVYVTVEPTHITTEAARAPDVHVTVEPAVVEFGEGSVRLDAPITIEPASVTVEAARAPDVNVTVEPSTVTVEPAQVTVEAAQAPNVEVRVDAPPPAEVNVTVEPSTLTVEAAPTPDIHLHVPERRKPPTARATREEDGSLTVRYEDEEQA